MKKNLSTANKLFMKLWFLTFLFLGACIPINNKIKVNFAESNTVSASAQSLSVAANSTLPVILSATTNNASLTLTYTIIAGPSHGTLLGTAPNLIYTPTASYVGADSFTFNANNGTVDSGNATITIIVTQVNHAPFIPSSLACTSGPLGSSTGNTCTLTAANPVDSDSGDTVTYFDNSSTCSTVMVNSSTGNATFTAPAKGGTCVVKVKAYDGHLYSSTITSATITGANNAPTIAAFLSCLTSPSAASSGNTCLLTSVVALDIDGDFVTYVDSGSTCSTVVVNSSTGDATFTAPTKGATCLVKIKAYDGSSYSGTVISATITGANRTPIATAQSKNVNYNTATAITLLGTDADGDSLTYAMVSGPSHGSLSGTAPNLIYTPGGYVGADSFTFKVNDGTNNSAPATVSITVDLAPNMIYLQTNGDDSTAALNDPTHPFVTAQAAVTAAAALSPAPGNEVVILMGAGIFGDVQLYQDFTYGSALSWQGVDSAGSSIIGNVVGDGANGVNPANIDLEVASGSKVVFGNISSNATDQNNRQFINGGSITVSAGAEAGNISANGNGDNGSWSGNWYQSGTGGTIVIGGAVGSISTSGGNAYSAGYTNAGNGGSVTVSGSAASIWAVGGSAQNYDGQSISYGGSGGNISVSGTVTSIAADGGFAMQVGGVGGNISISGTATTLSTQGGASSGYQPYGQGGNGGTVAVSGTTSTINISGGYADSEYVGRYGMTNAQGGSFGAVTITGGGQTGAITAVAGAVQAWGSITLNDVPSDGDTLTVGDGSNTITFEFQSSGGVTNGNTVVRSTTGDRGATADALRSALGILVDLRIANSNQTAGYPIFLQNRGSGAQGNVPITTTSGVIDVTGMTGGN